MAERPVTHSGAATPDVAGALARGWAIILATGVLFGVAGLVLGILWPVTYSATTTLSIAESAVAGDDSDTFMETQRLTLSSSRVLKPASEQVGGVTESELRDSLTALVPRSSRVLEISTSDTSSETAARKANAVAESFADYRARRGEASASARRALLGEQISRLRTVLSTQRKAALEEALLTELAALQTQRAATLTRPAPVAILTAARAPGSPATPPAAVFAAGGAAFGLLVGVLLALLRDRSRAAAAWRRA